MTTTLITGGTGFLGRHLISQLVAGQRATSSGKSEGRRTLRVLSISAPLAREPWHDEIEWIEGSITDAGAVARAVDGVHAIYHLAGRVSRSREDAHQMYEVHVEGTRQLCLAAQRSGAARIVMASTSGTIAVADNAQACPDETAPTPIAIISRWPYYASKLYQERVAAQICGTGGPELCTIHPSLLLGPGDDRLSSTTDVLRFLQRDIPLIPSGGINFVDARDAAAAFISAMERGKAGEHYLLGGPNWSFAEFFGRLERLTKVSGPKIKAPDKLALWGTRALEELYRRIDKAAPLDAISVEMANYFWYLDDAKARRDLAFVNRDPTETLHDTVRYLQTHLMRDTAL